MVPLRELYKLQLESREGATSSVTPQLKLSGIIDYLRQLEGYRQIIQGIDADEVHQPLALLESARAPVLAGILEATRRPILLITGRVDSVPVWQQALDAWVRDSSKIIRFLEPTPLPFERGPWSELSRNSRLAVLAHLMASQHPYTTTQDEQLLVITSIRALLQKTMPRRRFVAATRIIKKGQIIELESLLRDWQSSGYERVSVVESQGQYSQRGGILDIFPIGASNPTRIELFGDEVDSLRSFDPATQRSELVQENDSNIIISPAREMMPGDVVKVGQQLAQLELISDNKMPSWRDDVQSLASGLLNPNLEYYLPLVYSEPASLLSYLPSDTLIVLDDMPSLAVAADETESHAEQIAREQLDMPPNYTHPLFTWQEIQQKLSGRTCLVLGDGEDEIYQESSLLAESFQPGPRFGGQVRPFLLHLRASKLNDETTFVVSRQAQRLAELWRQDRARQEIISDDSYQPTNSVESIPPSDSITFIQGTLPGGFTLESLRGDKLDSNGRSDEIILNLLSDSEVFGWSRPVPRRRLKPRSVAPETYFADIVPGDYVVHLEFGIGKFSGLVVRAVGGMGREYLKVDFGNSDVLYVPVHHADRLSKWIGPDDRHPVIHRLGEKNWRRARSKAQKAVDELADELLDLYSARETIPGHAFAKDNQWQHELEASFPYRETDDQLRALAEVKADMERPSPMDRLICGDVGYGKTEVALRSAFKAVMDGKQVAILVPTTVLAQQHYNTFRDRLKPFPVNLEMLSRFRTSTQQDKILGSIREGQVDIVIGTHRLLSDDVSFKDLGLLIIDEEQRFGVSHKEKLKQLRTEVDVLTLTATPIPRTLYMSLAGVRDISQIDTAPADRLPVQTYVGEMDDSLIRTAILRELDRGGQVFFVHNRVQSIDNAYLKLGNLVPEARIAIAHGQMSERQLEEVMVRFVNGDIDVLLCTTIIESGLDIPNANTLIVERADWFGLAQLYQLRGRVGRGVRRAYGYFLHGSWHQLTGDAKARLDVLAAQTELGAGYTIAMRDLEIRGAGDLLGSRQSGHIAAVGFDLYTRLLTQAVKRRKAERAGKKATIELPEAVLIDLPLAAYIPTDYVPEASLRLRLYRRMAVLETLEEIDEMVAELADRFGAIPDPVDNLMYQLRVKVLAQKAAIPAITSESGQIHIRLPNGISANQYDFHRQVGPGIRVSRRGLWLDREMSTKDWQVTLVQVLEKIQSTEVVADAVRDKNNA
jgi:transcription-repair coupling factor (superfamily II helicase)